MVVVAHYFGEVPGGASALSGGWVGVGLFFILSGYLIGGVILDQKDEPDFLSSFYLKRAGRIFPAYALSLCLAYAGAALFEGRAWVDPLRSPLIYLTFTQNIAISLDGVEGSGWLLPSWTLAVEEQFYLLLPLAMLLLPARILIPALAALWTLAAIFRLAVYDASPLASFTLLPSRMDLLLAGVLAAVAHRKLELGPHLLVLRTAPLVALCGLLAVALVPSPKLFAIISPTLLSLGGAAFILSIVAGAPEARRFSGQGLRFFGVISYGLYLYHQPVAGLLYGILLDERPNFLTTPAAFVSLVAIVVSVVLAYASWRLVEAPLLLAARQRANGLAS